jgi:hypothetical protein
VLVTKPRFVRSLALLRFFLARALDAARGSLVTLEHQADFALLKFMSRAREPWQLDENTGWELLAAILSSLELLVGYAARQLNPGWSPVKLRNTRFEESGL